MKKFIILSCFLMFTSPALAVDWYNSQWGYRMSATVAGNDTATDGYSASIPIWYNKAPVAEDGIFEWFIRPADRYDGTDDATYFGYYSADSTVNIRKWNEDTKTLSSAVTLWSSWGYGDDHCAPSVLVLRHQTGANSGNNGKILVAVAEHNIRLQSRLSTNVEDISAFEAAVSVKTDNASYAHLAETTDGTVWLFYRINDASPYLQEYVYRTSSNSGASWSGETILCDFPNVLDYCMIDEDGVDIHIMINLADENLTTTGGNVAYMDIYYARYDGTDARWETRDGTAITMPITSTAECDVVVSTPRDAPADQDHRTFLFDIKSYSGVPVLISASSESDINIVTGTHTLDASFWNGSSWTTENITTCPCLGAKAYPVGGVLDDADSDIFYACHGDGSPGAPQMTKFERAVGGTWSKTEDITKSLTGDCFRPIAVRHGDGLFKVLFCYSERYEDFEDGDWDSILLAYPGFHTEYGVQLSGASQPDFEDLIFTDADGTTPIAASGKPYLSGVVSGKYALAEVKMDVPADGDDDAEIWMYYGNTSATNASDETVFLGNKKYSEAFSGSALPTGWTQNRGTCTVSGGNIILDGDATDDRVRWDNALPLGYEYHVRAKASAAGGAYWLGLWESSDLSSTTNGIQWFGATASAGQLTFIPREDGSSGSTVTITPGFDYTADFNDYWVRRTSASEIKYGYNTTVAGTFTTGTQIPDGTIYLYLYPVGTSTVVETVDWVYAIPYVAVAPTFTFSNAVGYVAPPFIPSAIIY